MTPEEMNREIDELEKAGLLADRRPTAVVKHCQFESFTDALEYLVEVGETAEHHGAMPAIAIDGGTDVELRIGRDPVPAMTPAEVRLAKAIAAI